MGVPDLGDLEMGAVFEILDSDHNNQISTDEVANAFFARHSPRANRVDSNAATASSGFDNKGLQYRTPVHRVGRLPPARVEGWDHLNPAPKFNHEVDVMKT